MTAGQAAGQESPVPELRSFVDQAETQIREVTDLIEPLDAGQLVWRPSPDRWSIGEHIAHLTLSNGPYLDAMASAIETAHERGIRGPPPYRHGWFGNWFMRSMEPPPRFRARTLRRLVPPRDLEKGRVLTDFIDAQLRAIELARRANGVDLGRVSIRSPYLRLIRLSIGQAFGVVAAHNRRHIWLAREVLRKLP